MKTAPELYQRLMTNLSHAKEIAVSPLSAPKLNTCLQKLGSFLYERSSEFEMLAKEENASVFLSICQSHKENVLLIFKHFLSDQAMVKSPYKSSSLFLVSLLDDFNSETEKLYREISGKRMSSNTNQ